MISCSSSKQSNNVKLRECADYYENDFAIIKELKYSTIFEGDSLSYTQIKFQCTRSALYNLRTMYGFFGKWHKSVFPANRKKPLLIWENVDLFSNGNKYNVVTFGEENSRDDVSTSFMIFNNKGEDLLLKNETFKNKAIEFFASNLRNTENKSKEYYHQYLREFAPDYWKKYKRWNNLE